MSDKTDWKEIAFKLRELLKQIEDSYEDFHPNMQYPFISHVHSEVKLAHNILKWDEKEKVWKIPGEKGKK